MHLQKVNSEHVVDRIYSNIVLIKQTVTAVSLLFTEERCGSTFSHYQCFQAGQKVLNTIIKLFFCLLFVIKLRLFGCFFKKHPALKIHQWVFTKTKLNIYLS